MTKILKKHTIVLENPKKGKSTIIKINNKVHYKRGSSDFSLSKDVIFRAYDYFKGGICSTTMLAEFDKEFTDKTGVPHCGCTFFLMLMREFSGKLILGKGVRGNPYYIEL